MGERNWQSGNWRSVHFSDGSLLEDGKVGLGSLCRGHNGQEQECTCGVGTVATVWDGEIGGMGEGLASISEKRNGNRNKAGAESTHIGRLQRGHRGCEDTGKDGEGKTPSFKRVCG